MIMRIDLTNHENKEAIEKFYAEHYSAPQYLMPTAHSINGESSNKEYYMYMDKLETVAIFAVTRLTPKHIMTSSAVVHKDHRGKGIGKKINEWYETYAKKYGYNKITSEIYVDNIPSIVLKLKRGYLIEGLMRNHDEPGKHVYTLGKEL